MKNHASEVVSDEAFAKREEKWSFDVPDTKEAYLIRDIFDSKCFFFWRLTRYQIKKRMAQVCSLLRPLPGLLYGKFATDFHPWTFFDQH